MKQTNILINLRPATLLAGLLLLLPVARSLADSTQYLYVSDLRSGLWKVSTADGSASFINAAGGGIGMTSDPDGNVYLAQPSGRIMKIDPDNNMTTHLSGLNSNPVYASGSAGWTASAPFGLTRDLFGNFYYTAYFLNDETGKSKDHNPKYFGGSFKIAPDNTITAWDNPLPYPYFMTSDQIGNIYLDGFGSGGILWQYDQSGAGSKTVRGTQRSCHGFTLDSQGNIYASCISYYGWVDSKNPSKVQSPNALWEIPVGGTEAILLDPTGFLGHPGAPVMDAAGNLYVADDHFNSLDPGSQQAGVIYKYSPPKDGGQWTKKVLVSGPELYDTISKQTKSFIQPFYMVITPAIPLPGQPTHVTQTSLSSTSASISWTPPSGTANVNGYHVFRATNADGPYSCLNLLALATRTTFTDVKRAAGTAYYYKVAAVNSAGTGDASNDSQLTKK